MIIKIINVNPSIIIKMTIILQVTESRPPFKTEQAAAELRVLGGWTLDSDNAEQQSKYE